MIDLDYIESDPSPMATQQAKFLEEFELTKIKESSPSTFYQRDCELHPDAPHCKEYDD